MIWEAPGERREEAGGMTQMLFACFAAGYTSRSARFAFVNPD